MASAFSPFVLLRNSKTSGNYTVSTTAVSFLDGGDASAFALYTSLPPEYRTLLQSSAGAIDFPDTYSSIALTMGGLTPGQNYLFEWWTDDSVFPGNVVTATAGNSVDLSTDPFGTGSAGETGQFVTGTFTADGTGSETVIFSNQNHYLDVEVNAFQLRDTSPATTPEPSSLFLAVCGALLAVCQGCIQRAAPEA
jgi:hypothetical protein